MAVTRKELLGGGAVAGVAALGVAPVAQAHGGDEDIVGSLERADHGAGSAAGLVREPDQLPHGRGADRVAPAVRARHAARAAARDDRARRLEAHREAFFRFLLQQAPPSAGEPIGTDNIHAGAIVFTARGTISGDRIEV